MGSTGFNPESALRQLRGGNGDGPPPTRNPFLTPRRSTPMGTAPPSGRNHGLGGRAPSESMRADRHLTSGTHHVPVHSHVSQPAGNATLAAENRELRERMEEAENLIGMLRSTCEQMATRIEEQEEQVCALSRSLSECHLRVQGAEVRVRELEDSAEGRMAAYEDTISNLRTELAAARGHSRPVRSTPMESSRSTMGADMPRPMSEQKKERTFSDSAARPSTAAPRASSARDTPMKHIRRQPPAPSAPPTLAAFTPATSHGKGARTNGTASKSRGVGQVTPSFPRQNSYRQGFEAKKQVSQQAETSNGGIPTFRISLGELLL